MKSVLVPTESHDVMRSVLETALLAGQRLDAYLEGFPLRPAIPEYVPIDMVSGLTWHADEEADGEAVEQSRAMFHAFMAENGVPAATGNEGRLSHGWYEAAPAGDSFVSGYARAFDLTVLGRPVTGKAIPSMATLEAALFESGRPILIAPPEIPTRLGQTIVIAWNGSTETALTTTVAMPFLRRAERVVVLSVEGGMVPGPSGEQLARSLSRHGIPAEAISAPNDKRGPGAGILDNAVSLGADMIVKGAYTQSRLRQLIFGGATSYLLAESTLPVLMAH